MTRSRRNLLLVTIPILFTFTSCGKRPPDPSKGNAAFFSGDYTKALREYGDQFGARPQNDTVATRMALSSFILGKYADFLNLYNLSLQLTAVHQKLEPSAVSVQILTADKHGGMDQKSALSPYLLPPQTGRDLPHLIRTRLLKGIAAHVVKNCRTQRDKALTILDFVHRNVRAQPDESEGEMSADPIGVLMRGYGVRERGAWAFVALAKQAGLRAHLLSLRDPDDPKLGSVHTLAMAWLDDKFVLLDTYAGIAISDPATGAPQSLEEVLRAPQSLQAILAHNPDYPLDPKFFQKALILIVLTPEAILPRMAVLQEVIRRELPKARDLPRVAEDPKAEILSCLALSGPAESAKPPQGLHELPYTFPDREYQFDIWAYPFHHMRATPGGFEYFRSLPKAQAEDPTYRNARLQQLLGNFLEAIAAYRQASNKQTLVEACTYNVAICAYEMGKTERAVEGLQAYLERYPDGVWKNLAHLHLGHALQKRGDAPAAKENFDKVTGPKALAARLAIAEMRRKRAEGQAESQEE